MKIPQTKYETIEGGTYRGYATEAVEDEGQYGPQVKFTMHLNEPNVDLLAWATRSFSNKSKLYKWTKAFWGGVEIPEDYNLDTDDLLERPVLVNVELKEGKDGPYNKVADILPIPKEGVVAAVPIPAPAPEGPPPWESEG